jgi:hypothetical protein
MFHAIDRGSVAQIAAMRTDRPLRPHLKTYRPAPAAAPRNPGPRATLASTRRRKTWHRETRRGLVAAVAVAMVIGGSISVYAIHSQMTQAAAHARTIALHATANQTSAALGSGSVVFMPEFGTNCRRRWLDNKTGTLRDGGEIHCDDAVEWDSANPTRAQKFERRMDAIRNGFQSRNSGTVE